MIAYDFVFVWLHLGNDEFPFQAVHADRGEAAGAPPGRPAATADAHVQGPRDRVHR